MGASEMTHRKSRDSGLRQKDGEAQCAGCEQRKIKSLRMTEKEHA